MSFLDSNLLARIHERAADADAANTYPEKDLEELREAGYLSAFVPTEFGGAGLSLTEIAAEQTALAKAAPGTALGINMHQIIVGLGRYLVAHGNARGEQILRDAVAGEVFGFGISEPGNDLVLFGSTTRATATGLRSAFLAWMPILGAAGLGQLFVGALTYLMPVVIGGGPSAVRVGVSVLEAAAPIREAARNAAALFALAVASLGGTSAERLTIAAWVVLLATYVVDIVLMARCGVAQARAKRAASSSPTTQGGRRG